MTVSRGYCLFIIKLILWKLNEDISKSPKTIALSDSLSTTWLLSKRTSFELFLDSCLASIISGPDLALATPWCPSWQTFFGTFLLTLTGTFLWKAWQFCLGTSWHFCSEWLVQIWVRNYKAAQKPGLLSGLAKPAEFGKPDVGIIV